MSLRISGLGDNIWSVTGFSQRGAEGQKGSKSLKSGIDDLAN